MLRLGIRNVVQRAEFAYSIKTAVRERKRLSDALDQADSCVVGSTCGPSQKGTNWIESTNKSIRQRILQAA